MSRHQSPPARQQPPAQQGAASQKLNNAPPPPATGAAPGASDGKPARTRLGMSNEKRLALALIKIIGAHDKGDTAIVKQAIADAKALVIDFETKIFTPIKNRLAEIRKELAQAVTQDGSGEKVKALALEQVKLENKIKSLSATTSAPAGTGAAQ